MNVKIEENINKFKKPLIEHMNEPVTNTPAKTNSSFSLVTWIIIITLVIAIVGAVYMYINRKSNNTQLEVTNNQPEVNNSNDHSEINSTEGRTEMTGGEFNTGE